MNDTPSRIADLADVCLAQANTLQQIQKSQNYQGPDEATLYAHEMNLRNKVVLLNTAAVGAALAGSAEAQDQLQRAIASAQAIAGTIQEVQKAIQMAADLVSLAAGVLSHNPDAVISAGSKLVSDAAGSSAG
jgi:hypothetical protein